ncbi:DNA mismatch repair protein MutT [Arachidicoccus ginsenosidimutans]|uniref:NUDIX domain-containing protein n=1 Tax=Arachidicoccus sp. BS20 TaxID=1850526 RepID=UPI0007F15FD4|nr:NUDIX hydrolase [Arachidicoccus sp. BS20]ANI88093.1 DNA mismatch repair protein MutT [Arachidicoccus sp. BS20]
MQQHENPWTIISSKNIYDNPWLNLTEYKVINPSGGGGIYGKVHFKNRAIGIVALDNENNIFLVGQYRFPTERYSWELPEGGGALDEEPLKAAQRELLEETGLVANDWQELMRMELSNSVTDEEAIVYLAKNLTQHEAKPEETEDLQTIKLPFEEVLTKVMNGGITDSITVAAILKLKVLGY